MEIQEQIDSKTDCAMNLSNQEKKIIIMQISVLIVRSSMRAKHYST